MRCIDPLQKYTLYTCFLSWSFDTKQERELTILSFFALFKLGNQRSAVKSVQPAKELVKSNKETFHETPREHYWTKSSFCICLHTESRVPRSLLNERTLELHRFFLRFCNVLYTGAATKIPKFIFTREIPEQNAAWMLGESGVSRLKVLLF